MNQSREPLLKGKLSTVDLLVPISFISAAFDNANIIYFFTNQATLMRRSTVLILPL